MTNNSIRIGLGFHPEELTAVRQNLEQYWAEYRKSTGIPLPDLTFFPIQSTHWCDDIAGDTIDIACIPSEKAPFQLPEAYLYFALKNGKRTERKLIIHADFFSPAEDLKLKPGTQVTVYDVEDGLLLQSINPETGFTIIQSQDAGAQQDLNKIHFQAILISHPEGESIQIPEDYTVVSLHPDEFPESAGNGKMVFGGHRDAVALLKSIQGCFHEKDIVACVNTEREIARYFENHPGIGVRVRCRKDERNNYHVKAAIIDSEAQKIFRHTISQSTHFKLAEKMIQVLRQHV